ncbi:MAG: hypothetical protein QOK30_1571, partial [Nocardioidaceae bacterium]|nr:hypothetical protein [Nocardioidaceae bacterium]
RVELRRTLEPIMWSQRYVIDYSLQRRATLSTLFRGGATSMDDVCDADPYTLRAAKHHGEPAPSPCPVCRKPELRLLSYVFGDELGQFSGRIKSRTEIEAMAHEHGEIRVYVLEVCRSCGWNHLVESYVVGDGTPRKPPRRQRTVEDDD